MTRVLIVDDEPGIRETFQAFLENEGYDVVVAADFFEAESFFSSLPGEIDIVVADIILPQVDGMALLQRVRQIDENIPVIIVTGEPDVSTAAEAVRLGAYDYVAKPVTRKVLNRIVGRAAEKKHLLDDKRHLEAENQAYQTELEQRVAARTAELEQRNQELATLIEISRDVSATLDLPTVLKRVTRRAAQVCGAHRCTIFMLGPDGEMVTPLMSQFGDGRIDRKMWRLFRDTRYPVLVSQVPEIQQIVGERRSLFISDASASSLPVHWIEPFGIESLFGVPMIRKEQVVGVMWLDHVEKGKTFTAEHANLAMAIGAQATIAIENARLFAETGRRLTETRLLQEAMQATASTLDFDEVLTRTIETLHKVLGFPYLAFAVPDEQGTGLVLHPSRVGYASVMHLPMAGSVSGLVYQSGEPRNIPDVRESPHYFDGAPDVRSELTVPVKVGGRVVAVLNAESTRLAAFDEDDLRLFSAIAAQLGMVLESTHLYDETSRRLTEAGLIQEVILAATSTLDFDLVLERTVKALYRALKIDRLGFLLPDERGDTLVSHPSLVGFGREGFHIPIEESWIGLAYQTGQPVLVRDAAQRPAYPEQPPDICSALAVPVRVGNRILAVLHAESPQANAFSEDELNIFVTIAGQLGVALDNARLYQQLESQAAKLAQANEELKEINRLRTELVQNVGHELRTPLGLVKGYVALLLAGDLGEISDDQREALEVVNARTITLEHMIHDLTVLQIVPGEAAGLIPESLVEAARQAMVDFQIPAAKSNITFRDELPEELPLVQGNLEQLKLVFSHLVDNAIKFSPDGGTITVCAWADQEKVHASISDEGIGIPLKHRERIFERFYQVDGSASRRYGGMGVGLALVWEIVEIHAGTVVVESEPGKGSIFTVTLPRADRVDE